MSVHHPSGRAFAEAFRSSGTSRTNLGVAQVLAVAFPGGGFPVEMLVFRTDAGIEERAVSESVFSVAFTAARMSPVANDALNALRLHRMGDPCVVVSGMRKIGGMRFCGRHSARITPERQNVKNP